MTIKSDLTNELQELFNVVGTVIASNVSTVPLNQTITTSTVINDDDNPYITSISNPTVTEGPGAVLNFAIQLSAGPIAGDDMSIAYRTVNGTAVDGSDYTGTGAGTSSLTINEGATSGTITISVTNDLVNEPAPDEIFTLEILPSSSLGLKWTGDPPTEPYTATGTIADANDAPITTADTYTVDEDKTITVTLALGVLVNDSDPEGSPITATLTTNPGHGTIVFQPDGSFVYTPNLNFNGTDTFAYKASDGDLLSASTPVTITINPINDRPTFITGPNIILDEDSGTYSNAWAEAISPGASNESTQVLTFTLSGYNAALFTVPPSLDPATGVLTFTLAPNATGTTNVTVALSDNGGTSNGGIDTSIPQVFNILINQINDAPTLSPGSNVTVNEDSGPYNTTWFNTSSLLRGPPDEIGQTLAITTTTSNSALFSVQPSVNVSTGALTFTSGADLNGTAIVTVTLQDNGGTYHSGLDTSVYTFTLTVNPVNDAPTLSPGSNVTVNEDSGAYDTTWFNTSSLSRGPSDEITQTLTITTTTSNSALFSSQPGVSIANGKLSFTPMATMNGTAIVTVTLQDNGGILYSGVDTSTYTFTLIVNALNDAPTLTPGSNVSVGEDSGAYNSTWFNTSSLSPGALNESSQTLAITTTNSNNTLFSVQPSVNVSTGALTFTPATNKNGTATITVTLQDNGGTLYGGVDTSTYTFTITVGARNDAPNMTPGSPVTVNEDSGAYSNVWFDTMTLSPGPSDESGQTLTLTTSNNNHALFTVQPDISISTGVMSFTPAPNMNGTATLTVTLKDNGGTLNGGEDSTTFLFLVTVNPVNDAPSLTPGSNVTVIEDSGAYNATWFNTTSLARGPSDEITQTLSITTTNSNNALFLVQPSVSVSTGVLTFTPATNISGSATVTVTLKDDGGTLYSGDDTTVYTFTITISGVNDAPSLTPGSNVTVAEDSSAYSNTWFNTSSLSTGSSDEIGQTLAITTTNSKNAFFSSQPSLNISTGVLTFTPAANINGTATVTVTLQDNGGTLYGGQDTAVYTFTITVDPVNDAPSLIGSGDVTVPEDSGAYNSTWFNTSSLSRGPSDEIGQTLAITTTTSNGALFSSQPSVNVSTGALTFQPTPNIHGSAVVTVTLQDNGGILSGGDDTTIYTFTITVALVNDAPSLTPGANVAVGEDSGAYDALWFNTSSLSPGPTDESSQTLSIVTTSSSSAFFSDQPAVSVTNGHLTFTPATNVNGTVVVTVTLKDDGGVLFGGDDTTAYTFTITVDPVNDPPTLTPGGNISVSEDSGAYNSTWFNTSTLSPGVANEIGQTLAITTTYSNSALFSTGGKPNVSVVNGMLSFTPAANISGSATVTVTLQDNAGLFGGGDDTNVYTFTITISALNDGPVVDADSTTAGINGAATYLENASDTLIAPNLTISDVEGDSITKIVVTIASPQSGGVETLGVTAGSIPVGMTATYIAGVLTIDGATANLTDTITLLKTLTYKNSSENPNLSPKITIELTDNGSPTPATTNPVAEITITVTPQNDPPTINFPQTFYANEGLTSTITINYLQATDPDTIDSSLVFTVTNTPAYGVLRKGSTTLGLNSTFTQSDINNGLITYTHDGSETISDTFKFNLGDGGTLLADNTFTITISPRNDAPIVTLTSGATLYVLGSSPVVIDAGALITDSDSLDFNTGGITVTLGLSGAIGDVLSVRTTSPISVSGTTVSYNGTPIGTISGGTYPLSLKITFASSGVSPAAVQALLENITYSNNASSVISRVRSATFTVGDGDGLASAAQSKAITIDLPPVAIDDIAYVTKNTSRKISVLANDSDPENDSITIVSVAAGSHGSVTIDPGNATVTYTPNLDFVGSETFTYTIADSWGGQATASVLVNVIEPMVFLPMVIVNGKPDLITTIEVVPSSPQAGIPATINVTVTNQGNGSATNFWVDFYINPNQVPEVNVPWNEICGMNPCYGLAWYYTGVIQPGQSIVLNSSPQSVDNPNGYRTDASIWPGYFANGSSKLYAIVDSWNRDSSGSVRDPNGAVEERDETNNRAERNIVVTPGTLMVVPQLQSTDDLRPRN
ncbi:MAG: tandem-95 repeat protein [Oscillochloris sp.]|nr:tandem-95 repeat protein [Oscillochloris sp.]